MAKAEAPAALETTDLATDLAMDQGMDLATASHPAAQLTTGPFLQFPKNTLRSGLTMRRGCRAVALACIAGISFAACICIDDKSAPSRDLNVVRHARLSGGCAPVSRNRKTLRSKSTMRGKSKTNCTVESQCWAQWIGLVAMATVMAMTVDQTMVAARAVKTA